MEEHVHAHLYLVHHPIRSAKQFSETTSVTNFMFSQIGDPG